MYSVYASPSRKGFFSTENHGEPFISSPGQVEGEAVLVRNPASTMPEDAVLVPGGREQVSSILAAVAAGKALDWSGGIPVVVDSVLTAAELLVKLQHSARQALLDSDKVAARCMKFGVAYPQAWRDRDAALVAIMNLAAGADPVSVTWPEDVPFPAGTSWEA